MKELPGPAQPKPVSALKTAQRSPARPPRGHHVTIANDADAAPDLISPGEDDTHQGALSEHHGDSLRPGQAAAPDGHVDGAFPADKVWASRAPYAGWPGSHWLGMAGQERVREISDDDGNRLKRIVRRGSGSVVTWRRAQMVLWSAQGMSVAQIAGLAFTSEDRVRDVLHDFNANAVESLYPRYAGRPTAWRTERPRCGPARARHPAGPAPGPAPIDVSVRDADPGLPAGGLLGHSAGARLLSTARPRPAFTPMASPRRPGRLVLKPSVPRRQA